MNSEIVYETYIAPDGTFSVDLFRDCWKSSYPYGYGFTDEEIRISLEDTEEGKEVQALMADALEIELLDDMAMVKAELRKAGKLLL